MQINALPTMIGLVDGAGVVDLAQDTLLFKLGPNSNKPEYNQGTGAATKTFNLSGATKDITAQAGHQASNTLNLIFTSLDAAGNPASS